MFKTGDRVFCIFKEEEGLEGTITEIHEGFGRQVVHFSPDNKAKAPLFEGFLPASFFMKPVAPA